MTTQTINSKVYDLSHNGEVKFTGSENDCYMKLQRLQGQSADWAMEYEGWNIEQNYLQQSLNFLNATNTALTIDYKTYGVHFAGETKSRHIFKCRLKNYRGSYTFDFGQSEASGKQQPTAYDILACLTKYDPETFEFFCRNYGYDPYNGHTGRRNMVSWKTYCAVLKEWNAIDKLFTDEEIKLLQQIA